MNDHVDLVSFSALTRRAAVQMASIPLPARLDGRAVLPGLPVPTDGL